MDEIRRHLPMQCWRVWFKDGSAMLVDAVDEIDAHNEAYRLAVQQDGEDDELIVAKTECLTDRGAPQK